MLQPHSYFAFHSGHCSRAGALQRTTSEHQYPVRSRNRSQRWVDLGTVVIKHGKPPMKKSSAITPPLPRHVFVPPPQSSSLATSDDPRTTVRSTTGWAANAHRGPFQLCLRARRAVVYASTKCRQSPNQLCGKHFLKSYRSWQAVRHSARSTEMSRGRKHRCISFRPVALELAGAGY
jgi:hypothetical protein